MKRQIKKTIAILLTVCFVLSITAAAVSAMEENPSNNVVPVDSVYLGHTYEQWSEKWWQWAVSIPTSSNPLVDTTGEFCAEGQSGNVWFLAGTTGATEVSRTCTIPAGKALFFPVINVLAFRSPPEKTGNTQKQLRESAKAVIDTVTVKEVEIDGTKLDSSYLNNFRVGSGLFVVKFAKDNIFNVIMPHYSTPAVSDGYWIMLKPLSEGEHTIKFKGEDDYINLEVTYYITVT